MIAIGVWLSLTAAFLAGRASGERRFARAVKLAVATVAPEREVTP
ncbi:hypothetical protein [Amycolatopsis sp. NPDC004625]